jgi:inner membrane protein
MDNITHSLTGWAMARAGLDRLCPQGATLLILSANAPDIDILALAQSPMSYFEAHRGYTHSVLLLPLMAVLPVLATAALSRRRLLWLRAWLLCCAGVASHLLIDWTNNYGVRLLLPFSSRWFHLDLNYLYDGTIMMVLLLAALWPFFAWLVSHEIGDRTPPGRGIARFALAFFILFDCFRGLLHHSAVTKLESRLYDEAPPIQAAAFPEPYNPLHWNGAVETAGAYLSIPMNSYGELDMLDAQTYFKPAVTASIENAKKEEPFRYFRYFARFPIWSEAPVDLDGRTGKRIELTDLRFGTPGAGSFHCIALEDDRNQVLQTWFTYGSGTQLGSKLVPDH